jgi:hypothetical protein
MSMKIKCKRKGISIIFYFMEILDSRMEFSQQFYT